MEPARVSCHGVSADSVWLLGVWWAWGVQSQPGRACKALTRSGVRRPWRCRVPPTQLRSTPTCSRSEPARERVTSWTGRCSRWPRPSRAGSPSLSTTRGGRWGTWLPGSTRPPAACGRYSRNLPSTAARRHPARAADKRIARLATARAAVQAAAVHHLVASSGRDPLTAPGRSRTGERPGRHGPGKRSCPHRSAHPGRSRREPWPGRTRRADRRP